MAQTSAAESVLQVTVERLPDSEVRITAEAPPEVADEGIARAVTQLARQVKLPGFRPGKAPAPVVERAVGWDAIRQEAIDAVLPRLYEQALRQEELDPVTSPNVTEVDLERGRPVRFAATLVVRPKVTLGAWRQIRVPAIEKPVPEGEVESTLEELRQRYAQLSEPEGRAVQPGDVVTARLTMHHGDQLVGTPGQEQTLDLQRGDLLPGMADQLVGAAIGAEPLEINLTLPEDYPREELRGELVTIEAAITRIQEKELPALDDNLAAIVGRGETLEGLRQFVREQIGTEMATQAEREWAQKVLEELLEVTRVDVPEAMIQAEIDRELGEMERNLRDAGLGLEALLSAQGKSMEQLRGEQRQGALERVRLDLALDQVGADERLEVSDEEVDQTLSSVLAKGSSRDARRRAREPLRRQLRRSRARELVLAAARGEAVGEPQGG